jgi:hypothetical protein
MKAHPQNSRNQFNIFKLVFTLESAHDNPPQIIIINRAAASL